MFDTTGIDSSMPDALGVDAGAARSYSGCPARTGEEITMTNPTTGRFTWHEMMSTDVSKSVKFYTELFGWRTETMDMGPAGNYTLFLAGDQGVGGCLQGQPGVPSHWLTYVGAQD